mgnify:CR=1 FL=1|jgi:hypothetical protein
MEPTAFSSSDFLERLAAFASVPPTSLFLASPVRRSEQRRLLHASLPALPTDQRTRRALAPGVYVITVGVLPQATAAVSYALESMTRAPWVTSAALGVHILSVTIDSQRTRSHGLVTWQVVLVVLLLIPTALMGVAAFTNHRRQHTFTWGRRTVASLLRHECAETKDCPQAQVNSAASHASI